MKTKRFYPIQPKTALRQLTLSHPLLGFFGVFIGVPVAMLLTVTLAVTAAAVPMSLMMG